jgi:hypothetical protein
MPKNSDPPKDPPTKKALYINDFPPELRDEIEKMARGSNYSLRVTVLTLIREALVTRRKA